MFYYCKLNLSLVAYFGTSIQQVKYIYFFRGIFLGSVDGDLHCGEILIWDSIHVVLIICGLLRFLNPMNFISFVYYL